MDHPGLGRGPLGGRRPLTRAAAALRARAPSLVLAALVVAGLAGCQRSPRFKPLPPDSTATASRDSVRAATEAAVRGWERGGGEEAARLTAEALLGVIRPLPVSEWEGRSRALLDSLAIGAEVGASGNAMLVNLFSRSDPEHGSWPWLYWSAGKAVRMQALEGRDLRLVEMVARDGPGAPAGVAALFTRRGATGGLPIAFAWKAGPGGSYALAQTLGSDSLGGAGSGEFARADTSFELRARTYRPARGFTECAACPHAYTLHRFRWTESGFARESSQPVPSAYASVVRFVNALEANDRQAGFEVLADGALWDEARRLDWHQARGLWRVAPSTAENAREMVLFRGEREAYRVTFESRGGDWKLASLEATTRTVE